MIPFAAGMLNGYAPGFLGASVGDFLVAQDDVEEHLLEVYRRGPHGSSVAELQEVLRWAHSQGVDVDPALMETWISTAGDSPALLLAAVHRMLELARSRPRRSAIREAFEEAQAWRRWAQDWSEWWQEWAPTLLIGTTLVGTAVVAVAALGVAGVLGTSAFGGSGMLAAVGLSEASRRVPT